MRLSHQYNSNGSHRIVELDYGGFLKTPGEWVGYNNIATYKFNGVIYISVTDYFAGGNLEVDAIYQLSRTDFTSEKPVRWTEANEEQANGRFERGNKK